MCENLYKYREFALIHFIKLEASQWRTMLQILTIATALLAINAQDCQPRDYGNGATVCVCNSTYCDTIETPEKLNQPQYYKYTSDKAGSRFRKGIEKFTTSADDSSINIIKIDSTIEYQTINGWGGAFSDATGINIKSLNEAAQDKLLDAYFSKNGIEYSIGRVPIGGTDFSTRGYSYDDGDEDESLTNWKLAQEDLDYKIPYIKKAFNITNGNLQLFASAWTAPKWMKTNKQYAGSGYLLNKYYQAWANYFVKFLDAYASENINFWAVTTGNEALSLVLNPFNKINVVGWTSLTLGNWILNNFGPTIRQSNHSNIKIMIHDDQRLFLPWAVDIALKNAEAKKYIDGIAVHWYFDKFSPAGLLTDTHNKYPDKFILATEACKGDSIFEDSVSLGSWERGEDYANSIIEDVNNWVTGWTDWNMALDLTGGPTYIDNNVDSPIIVNAASGEFYKQPMFYALGHFAKFVPRGSVRISSSGFSDNVPVVAFKRPDNATVLVILNKRDFDVSTKIVDNLRGTTEITLTAKSINTVLYW